MARRANLDAAPAADARRHVLPVRLSLRRRDHDALLPRHVVADDGRLGDRDDVGRLADGDLGLPEQPERERAGELQVNPHRDGEIGGGRRGQDGVHHTLQRRRTGREPHDRQLARVHGLQVCLHDVRAEDERVAGGEADDVLAVRDERAFIGAVRDHHARLRNAQRHPDESATGEHERAPRIAPGLRRARRCEQRLGTDERRLALLRDHLADDLPVSDVITIRHDERDEFSLEGRADLLLFQRVRPTCSPHGNGQRRALHRRHRNRRSGGPSVARASVDRARASGRRGTGEQGERREPRVLHGVPQRSASASAWR
jgi:hypothetical protein